MRGILWLRGAHMSDERALAVGRLVLEHEQQKRDLAALEANARAIGVNFMRIGRALLDGVALRTAADGELSVMTASTEWIAIKPVGWDEIAELLRAIEAARANIRNTEDQRRHLGV